MSRMPGPGQPKKATTTVCSVPVLTFLRSCDRFYGGFLGGGQLVYTKLIHVFPGQPQYRLCSGSSLLQHFHSCTQNLIPCQGV